MNPDQQSDFLIDPIKKYLNKIESGIHFPHRHSFYHLALFTKGSGKHSIDFNWYEVSAYQLYFMIPGQVHGWYFDKKTEGYTVNFSHSLFQGFLANAHYMEQFSFFKGESSQSVFHLPASMQQKFVYVFEELLQEALKGKAMNLNAVRVLLLQLFIQVDEHLVASELKTEAKGTLAHVRQLRSLIEKNYKQYKLPKDYAVMLNMTPNYLNGVCRDLLGKTAGELIRERIILEAKRLLLNAGMSSAEIAFDLGFENNSYFTQFFKRSTGITPDLFRKQIAER